MLGCSHTPNRGLDKNHAWNQKVSSEGSKFENIFFCFYLMNGERIHANTNLSGTSWACQRNAIKMAFHWRTDDGQTLNAGLAQL